MLKTPLTALLNRLNAQISPADPTQVSPLVWWLLEDTLSLSKSQIINSCSREPKIGPVLSIHRRDVERVENSIIQHIQNDKPIQYILRDHPFGSLSLKLRPPFLIPRSETEHWVYSLIEDLKREDRPLKILDIGCGSGAISLAVGHELPGVSVVGVDSNPEAVALSEENRRKNRVQNVKFDVVSVDSNRSWREDILRRHGKFDVILSNPPYIPAKDWLDIEGSVRYWEDPSALICGSNGLEICEAVIKESSFLLESSDSLETPRLVLEIGEDYQKVRIEHLMRGNGFTATTAHKDIYDRTRYVCGYC